MSIFYKLNSFTQNSENKLLISNLCNKFIIRNQIDSNTYVIENGIFFFALNTKQLKKIKKNFRKKKRKKYYSFLLKNKKQKILERLSTYSLVKKSSKFSSKTKILKYKKNLQLKKGEKKTIYKFKGHSIRGDLAVFKFKKNFKRKLFLFFKKKKKINFLKHRLFLIKLILKLKKNKIPFSGFIKKTKKGGYLCKSIIFSIKAFLPKVHVVQPFKKSFKKLFLKLFNLLNLSTYEDIIKSYIIFCYKKKKNFKSFETVLSKYKNKILFPLYIGSFKKKISRIKEKKIIKFFYKLKRKNRRLFSKKKAKLFRKKKKFRRCYYNIVFISKLSEKGVFQLIKKHKALEKNLLKKKVGTIFTSKKNKVIKLKK
jgi:hypothetical protein